MVIDHEDLRRWQVRMGYSYDDAAKELGVDRSTYAVWLKGVSRNSNKPFDLPRMVQLSTMAIEAGLASGLPPAKVRSKGRKASHVEESKPHSKESQVIEIAE